ncbi:hypothetical protein SCB49_01352 [unidentified eubacterium SCB49]|nr:hypothetical protein SCB49_01352 [unidentified eubacterium SCB49]
MKTIWMLLIVISLFAIITFVYWKLTHDYAEKQYGKKLFKQWGARTFYWTGALFISGAITVSVIYLLKIGNVLVV